MRGAAAGGTAFETEKELFMKTYRTTGTCSRAINYEVSDGVVTACEFVGGCPGNTQGVAKIVAPQRPARALDPYIRGLSPIPLAFVRRADGKMLKIVSCEVREENGPAGTVIGLDDRKNGGILVACGEGALLLTEIVPEGKGKMKAADYVRDRQIQIGEVLS